MTDARDHTDGLQVEYFVGDDDGNDLPNLGITIYANGTWEYTNPDLRDEVEL